MKIRIALATRNRNGDDVEHVDAIPVGEYLAIHRGYLSREWAISHINSGRRVATAPTKALAQHLAGILSTATNWANATTREDRQTLALDIAPIMRDWNAANISDRVDQQRILGAIGNAINGDPEPMLAPHTTRAWLLRQLVSAAPNGAGV